MKLLIFAMLLLWQGTVAQPAQVRIACVGNSITYGSGLADRESDAYPAQLQTLLGNYYAVMNFGVSGATLLKNGNNPYHKTVQYKEALASSPDIVFIKLGTNDSKLVNRPYLQEFQSNCRELALSFATLPSKPRVVLLLPIPAFTTDTSQIWDPVMTKQIIPAIQQVAFETGLEVINLHPLLIDKPTLLPDKVHPNVQGATVIANRLFEFVLRVTDKTFDLLSTLPQPQVISSFYGYTCADFTFNGRNCKVVRPKAAAAGNPWIWRARFWGHEPQADIALLERGFHLVYCDVAELYGNPESIQAWNRFYELLRNGGLSARVALEGMSRGGVYIYNWAAVNPEKVACIYADNPVLDLKSWPGGKGRGPGSKTDWEIFKKDYGLTTEAAAWAFKGSPIDKIDLIARGRYPMLHVCADADEAVPISENNDPFVTKIRARGGNITVIYKRGFKHHPHSLPNPMPIVDFILRATKQVQQ